MISSATDTFKDYFFPTVKSQPNACQQVLKAATLGAGLIGSFIIVVKLENEGLLNDVILVPIFEEILYRGIVQSVAGVAYTSFKGKPKNQAQIAALKTFRAVAGAAVFGLHHELGVLQKFWFLGRACAYLKEESEGYVLPIALHMTHNALAMTMEDWLVNRSIPLPLALTVDAAVLWALGKRINPLASIKDTFFPAKTEQAVLKGQRANNRL